MKTEKARKFRDKRSEACYSESDDTYIRHRRHLVGDCPLKTEKYLTQDLGSGQIAHQSHFASCTEYAASITADLSGHAERCAVVFVARDHHRLYTAASLSNNSID